MKHLSDISCVFANERIRDVTSRVSVDTRLTEVGHSWCQAIQAAIVRLHALDGCSKCREFGGGIEQKPFGLMIVIPPLQGDVSQGGDK